MLVATIMFRVGMKIKYIENGRPSLYNDNIKWNFPKLFRANPHFHIRLIAIFSTIYMRGLREKYRDNERRGKKKWMRQTNRKIYRKPKRKRKP